MEREGDMQVPGGCVKVTQVAPFEKTEGNGSLNWPILVLFCVLLFFKRSTFMLTLVSWMFPVIVEVSFCIRTLRM